GRDELVHDFQGGAGRGGVDRSGPLVGEGGAGGGGGVHGDGDPPPRRDVPERSEPRTPVRDPPVGVGGVREPGGGRHDSQGGGQVAGVPVADQPVPSAVAILRG